MTLVIWETIRQDFQNGVLVLGNGASIAICEKFNYSNLRQEAVSGKYIDTHLDNLFKLFKTDDFEKVLECLFITAQTNQILKLNHRMPKKYHKKLRQGLLDVLGSIHPKYKEVQVVLSEIVNFINNFQVIVSLNYDLLLYWAVMKEQGQNRFRDFFGSEGLIDVSMTESNKNNRVVLFPHGNLCICKSMMGASLAKSSQTVYERREFKVRCTNDSTEYDNASILDILEANEFLEPVLVSEGVTEEKQISIHESEYLDHIFKYLQKIKRRNADSFKKVATIYGCSFSENDRHIFDKMANGISEGYAFDRVAVSVYGNDLTIQNKAISVLTTSNIVSAENIVFFDALNCGWPQVNNTTL